MVASSLPSLCLLVATLIGETLAVSKCDVNPSHPDCDGKRASWGYSASNGPATWATNYPDYCAGDMQSPIDLDSSKAVMMDPGPITMVGYNLEQMGRINNNGHTLGFTFVNASTPYIMGGRLPAGDRFEFLQLHWHWGSDSSKGSEHTMDGKEYPIEVHLVHVNTKYYVDGAASNENFAKPDGLAVIGIFYEVSTEDNANLTNIVSKVNEVADYIQLRRKRKQGRADINEVDLDMNLRLDSFLPADTTQYYYYQGGLTTPNCDEAVLWTNMKSTQTISEAQLEVFRTMTDNDGTSLNNNYRPPQPLNARTIYSTGTTAASSNIITDLLNTAFTAAVVTGLVGIVAPLFSPPPSQQRSDAASARAEQALRAGRDQWGGYWG